MATLPGGDSGRRERRWILATLPGSDRRGGPLRGGLIPGRAGAEHDRRGRDTRAAAGDAAWCAAVLGPVSAAAAMTVEFEECIKDSPRFRCADPRWARAGPTAFVHRRAGALRCDPDVAAGTGGGPASDKALAPPCPQPRGTGTKTSPSQSPRARVLRGRPGSRGHSHLWHCPFRFVSASSCSDHLLPLCPQGPCRPALGTVV